MHRLLWALQIAFGTYFVLVGVTHFIVPAGLPEPMAWMYDLSPTLHTVSGAAEILGGLGLILPGLTRIQPRLTSFAALGLLAVMLLASAWHMQRGEYQNIVGNLIMGGVMAFIAYGRLRLRPLTA
ncbi:MAG: DoxX family protein [Dehalococcoidia bacterium]